MAAASRPPGPPRGFPFVRLLTMSRDPLAFFTGLQREYGDLVHFQIGPQQIYLVSDPELIREVLVVQAKHMRKDRGMDVAKLLLGEGLLTSEGEFHKRQRRLAQPAFHHQRIASYADVMSRFSARQLGSWRDGQTLDVHAEMMRLALAIVGKTLFDTDTEQEAKEIASALDDVMELFTLARIPFARLLDRFPVLPSTRRFRRARARLDETVYRLIREHREAGVDRGDLMSMLIAAQDVEGDGGQMSDQQLRDEAMTIFLAGHETTANALAWTLYLLSQHPEIEARMHAEVDEVVGGAAPGLEHFKRLAYTERVFAEAMRLFPPAWTLGRHVAEEISLGGYRIPKDATIITSQWVVHHDARLYSEPYRFDPERFRPEQKAERPKFAYFPFGGGPRICIGESFAWMEGVLVLASIAQRFRLRLVAGHPVVPQPRITLRLAHGLRMTVHARERQRAVA